VSLILALSTVCVAQASEKPHVLKSSNNLINGFTRIEDGPRSPVPFSNPGTDVFFAPRPEGFEDRMFYRIEGE